MDLSLNFIKYYNSFSSIKHNYINIEKYSNDKIITLKPSYKINKDKPVLNINNLNKNNNIKTFINKDATILANIDAIYNLLEVDNVNILRTDDINDFTYMLVQDDISGFVQYIQYRKTNAFGVGLNNGNKWDYKYINVKLFKPYDGYDMTGELHNNWQHFINDANGDINDKYKLVICNDINNFIIQCIIGLSCSSKNFVVRCNDTVSNINVQILYLLSLCFNYISIIKPISTDINNDNKYVICEGIKNNNLIYINILKNALKYNNLISIYNTALPTDFINWLTIQNDNISSYKLNFNKDDYDYSNLFTYWNLPDDYIKKPVNNYII